MPKTMHFVVSGRVQGVWFRRAAKQRADLHGVTGWVHNLADGRVEGMARGSAEQLAEFHRWLQRGPDLARVLRVDWSEAADENFADFSVR